MPKSFPFRIATRIVCEHGAIEWTIRFLGAGPPEMRVTRYDRSGSPQQIGPLGENPYDVECRHFVATVRGDADPELLSAERALEGLRVLDAARRSAAASRPIDPQS
jgi:predicted dehydrogenase